MAAFGMCFPLAVVRDALLFPTSYPAVVRALLLVPPPVLLSPARTSDNPDVSAAARIRTAAIARISLSMAASCLTTEVGTQISPFDGAREIVRRPQCAWLIAPDLRHVLLPARHLRSPARQEAEPPSHARMTPRR